MSDASTKRLIEAYMDDAPAPSFLSSQATRVHFHNSKKVEIDIERDDEDVAVVVTDMSAGGRKNESTLTTNKEFEPPVYKEESTLNGFELIQRNAGESPYVDPDYQANAITRSFKVFRLLEKKIRRAIEVQASQVLQGGVLTLTDESGNALYTLDYGMRAAHKAAAGAAWSGLLSSSTPLTHIEDRARLLRRNGKRTPNQLIFGRTAWSNFWRNTYIQSLLDNRGMNNVDLRGMGASITRGGTPPAPIEDANFEGRLTVGPFNFELWTYDAEYKDPQTDLHVPYVSADNLIMKSRDSRIDLSYGNIPFAVRPDQRVMPFLPTRMSSTSRGLDIITNAYPAQDNTGVVVGAYARPLVIPAAIDTIGVMDTSS